jgi:hypothetical protein
METAFDPVSKHGAGSAQADVNHEDAGDVEEERFVKDWAPAFAGATIEEVYVGQAACGLTRRC